MEAKKPALRREDAKMQDVLLCVQTGKTVDDENRMKFQTEEFYLKSEEELRQLFPGCDEAFENTARIAERCNLEFVFNEPGQRHRSRHSPTAWRQQHKIQDRRLELCSSDCVTVPSHNTGSRRP